MMKRSGLSRRQFLTGATVGAVSIAAAGALGGCAPKAEPQAESASAKNWKELSLEDLSEGETLDADVCVIGAGISGLCAAVAAAESGAKVVLLEAGSTLLPGYGHAIMACGTEWQKEQGIELTVEEMVADLMESGDPHLSKELITFAAEKSAENISWLAAHGVDFVPGATTVESDNMVLPRRQFHTKSYGDGTAGFLAPLLASAEAAGADVRFSTLALDLIISESGAVEGVIANNEGAKLTVNAKSTVICAGGYCANDVLLREYAPRIPNAGPGVQMVRPDSSGFAIRMGKKLGAEIVATGGVVGCFMNAHGATFDDLGQCMHVSVDGKRFINENVHWNGRGVPYFEKGVSHAYIVFDEKLYTEGIYQPMRAMLGEGKCDAAIEAGSAYKEDSIEALAAKIGCNGATLKETVERYNGFCAAGVDEDFGKPADVIGWFMDPERENLYDIDGWEESFHLLNPVATPPFYAVRINLNTASIYGTSGGVKIDKDARVLDTYGNPIPGLYAAGESANGELLAASYPHGGSSLMVCSIFGRHGGLAASADAQR